MSADDSRRKKLQREKDRALGWREVVVKVAEDQVTAVRNFAASLPAPQTPIDPRQLDLIDRIEAELAEGASGSLGFSWGPEGAATTKAVVGEGFRLMFGAMKEESQDEEQTETKAAKG
jgi:hypothetical protein